MSIFNKTYIMVLTVLLEYIDPFNLSGNIKQLFGSSYHALYHPITLSLAIVHIANITKCILLEFVSIIQAFCSAFAFAFLLF